MNNALRTFDSFLKGYKNYIAYGVTLAAVLALYFGEGTDLKEIAVLVGGLATFFGIFARASQQ